MLRTMHFLFLCVLFFGITSGIAVAQDGSDGSDGSAVGAPPVVDPPEDAPPVENPPDDAPPVDAPPEDKGAPPDGGPPDDAPPVDAPPEDKGAPPDGGPPDDVPRGNGPPEDAPAICVIVDRTELLSPDAGGDEMDGQPGPSGHAQLVENPGLSAIHVHVRHLTKGVMFDVEISKGDDSEIIGSITIRGDGMDGDGMDGDGMDPMTGSGGLLINTRRGDTLPLGAESVADLADATISVLNPTGAVMVTGDIGDFDTVVGQCNGVDGGDGGDGEGAEEMVEAALALVLSFPHDAPFLRGDVNGDSLFDVSDPVRALGALFLGEAAPYCLDSADANDDGFFDVSDPIRMLSSLFVDGDPLPAPGSETPGFDLTPDVLFCQG